MTLGHQIIATLLLMPFVAIALAFFLALRWFTGADMSGWWGPRQPEGHWFRDLQARHAARTAAFADWTRYTGWF
jgi:hypothetical protein